MSYSVGKIHKYSVDLYQGLEAETGQPVSFQKTRGICDWPGIRRGWMNTEDTGDSFHNRCSF
ncbi:MAG: hypothetical protein CM1200mP30_05530 [Pseudomonadota bacterium]|nr:MAG: hypothetical protein CM1200mP30_05530 [Pseudomonadota bacterium]